MRFWIIQSGEPLPGLDGDVREWRCTLLAKALIGRSHQVRYWASTFNHTLKQPRFPCACTFQPEPGLEIRLLHSPGYTRNVSLRRLWQQRCVAKTFAREAPRCAKPDLIFCALPTPELAEEAIHYGERQEVPVVIDIRDPWPDIYLMAIPSFLRGLGRVLLAAEFRRIRRICRGATALVAVSESYLAWALQHAQRAQRTADAVFHLGSSRPELRCAGQAVIAERRARWHLSEPMLVVAFIGMFGASSDLQTVVQSARLLLERGLHHIHFVLGGSGDQESVLKILARGLPNVHFPGWLDRQAAQELLSIADIGLAAYAAEAVQSLPNKPFEYMAAGLPLLSSLRGDLAAIIGNHQMGLQYEAGNAAQLAGRIEWLANHPAERAQMGANARRLFETQFDAAVIYPRLAQYLESMGKSSFNAPSVR